MPGRPTAATRGLTRRRLLQGAGAAAGLFGLAALGGGALNDGGKRNPWHPARRRGPVFGMLQAEPDDYRTLAEAGVRAVTLPVVWKLAQPRPGALDRGYLREVRRRHDGARESGLTVALSPGLQYPADWVFGLPGGARFVNQDGREWRGGTGDDVADAVFNSTVREAQEDYLGRLAEALAELRPAGVRVGGLARGELHYPPVDRNGARNTFWAFGSSARTDCPVPGFRPGTGSPQDALAFLDWYLDTLADYGRWQVDVVRRGFGPSPRLLVLLPSWGVRPGEVQRAAASALDGSTSGERRGTLTEGVDWTRQARLLAAAEGVDLCTTWLDAEDQGEDVGSTSPGRYLADVAAQHRLQVWGENTGDNDDKELRRCGQRVDELQLAGLFWMGARQLGEDGNATLEDYAALIGADR